MRTTVLAVTTIRRWSAPIAGLVNGYSSNHGVYHVPETAPRIVLAPGGWSLSAAAYQAISWHSGRPDQEGMYDVILNGERAYASLWTPKLGETVTESFFWDGDLCILNYRLLKVIDA